MSNAYLGSIPIIITEFYLDENGSEYVKCQVPLLGEMSLLTGLIEVKYANS